MNGKGGKGSGRGKIGGRGGEGRGGEETEGIPGFLVKSSPV